MSKSDQEEHHMILFRKLDRCFGGNISDSIDSHATLVAVASYSLVHNPGKALDSRLLVSLEVETNHFCDAHS